MATDRRNACVQVSYQVPVQNCSRELVGATISKPPQPTAKYNRSTVVGSSRPVQYGSVKQILKESCASAVAQCSEQGQRVGGGRQGEQGLHWKHSQKGGDTPELSEVGSCETPSTKAVTHKVSSWNYLKAIKDQSLVVKHSRRVGNVAVPKQVLEESLQVGTGICSTEAVVKDSLSSPPLCGKLQAEETVLEAEIDHPTGCLDVVDAHVKDGSGIYDALLNPKISISNYHSPLNSFFSGNQFADTNSVKDSFVTANVSDGTSSVEQKCGSAKLSDPRDLVESEKNSNCRGSTGSHISDESSCSSFSNSTSKPHKANDSRWEAIRAVRSRDRALGLTHFRFLKRLGCGDIGKVYLTELCGTKSYFAMKVMNKGDLASRKKLSRAQTEREVLHSLDHPFLPTLYTHFETDKFSCLVMEFCPGGDLHTLQQRQPGRSFPEQAARFYVAEVLLALEYLHMLGIIYRDLKPENVLVRDDGHIMLSDFDLALRCAVCPTLVRSSNMGMSSSKKDSGYCVQPTCIEPTCVIQPSCLQPTCFSPGILPEMSKKEKKSKSKTKVNDQVSQLPELLAEPTNARSMSFVGTHEYLAPEIIKGEGHGSAVDWWTFGIFLYELLFGKTPFRASENRATLFNVVGQPLRFPEYPTVSFAARDLIRGLLVKEPQHRLAYRRGATEVKQHPFFQSVNWALIRCTNPPEVPKPVEIVDFLPRTEVAAASTSETAGVDVKPSGNYLEIDFF